MIRLWRSDRGLNTNHKRKEAVAMTMKNMNENEDIVYECKTHWIALLLPSIVAIFFFLLFITGLTNAEIRETSFLFLVIALLSFGIPFLRVKTDHLVLTDKQIYGKTGIIKTQSLTAPISKIQTVNINTSLLGRILGYSDLVIHCITGVYYFKKQANAKEMQNAIINAIK